MLACDDALTQAIKLVDDTELWFKPAPNKWNIHQILTHVRDVQHDLFLPRIGLALKSPGTAIQPFDADAYMQAHYIVTNICCSCKRPKI